MRDFNSWQYPWPPTLFFYVVLGVTLFYPVAGAEDIPAQPDFSGVWQFNEELSDNPRDKMREAMSDRGGPSAHPGRPGGGLGGRGGMGGGGRGGGGMRGGMGGRGGGGEDLQAARAQMRAMMEASRQLEIEHRDERLTLRADGVDLEEIFLTDGRAFERRFGGGDPLPASARWKEDRLIVETETPRGGELREIYELTEEGLLRITVETEGDSRRPGIEFQRIYERAEG